MAGESLETAAELDDLLDLRIALDLALEPVDLLRRFAERLGHVGDELGDLIDLVVRHPEDPSDVRG